MCCLSKLGILSDRFEISYLMVFRLVELLLNLSVEYSFVLEELSTGTIVGFAVGCENVVNFQKKLKLLDLANLHENSLLTSTSDVSCNQLRVVGEDVNPTSAIVETSPYAKVIGIKLYFCFVLN